MAACDQQDLYEHHTADEEIGFGPGAERVKDAVTRRGLRPAHTTLKRRSLSHEALGG